MFLSEVALGKECTITKDNCSLKKAPAGHDSVVARGTVEPGTILPQFYSYSKIKPLSCSQVKCQYIERALSLSCILICTTATNCSRSCRSPRLILLLVSPVLIEMKDAAYFCLGKFLTPAFSDPSKDIFITLEGKKVAVPQGKPIDQPQFSDSYFSSSEYLIYKESQCCLRYLLELNMR